MKYFRNFFSVFLFIMSFYSVSVVFSQEDDLSSNFETYTLLESTPLIVYPANTPEVITILQNGQVELYIHRDEILEFENEYYVFVTYLEDDRSIDGYLVMTYLDGITLENVRVMPQVVSGYWAWGSGSDVNVRALPNSSASLVGKITSQVGLHILHSDTLSQLTILYPDLSFSIHPDYPLVTIINSEQFETSSDIWMPVLLDNTLRNINMLATTNIGFVALRFNNSSLAIVKQDETHIAWRVPIRRILSSGVEIGAWETADVGYGRGFGFNVYVFGEISTIPIRLSDETSIIGSIPVIWYDALGELQTAVLPLWIQNNGDSHVIRERESIFRNSSFSEQAISNYAKRQGLVEGKQLWVTLATLEAITAETWGNVTSIRHDNLTIDEATGQFMFTAQDLQAFRNSGNPEVLLSAVTHQDYKILMPWIVVNFATNQPVPDTVCNKGTMITSGGFRQSMTQIIYLENRENLCITSDNGQFNRLILSPNQVELFPNAVRVSLGEITVANDNNTVLVEMFQFVYDLERNDLNPFRDAVIVNLMTGEIIYPATQEERASYFRNIVLSPQGDKLIYSTDTEYTLMQLEDNQRTVIRSSLVSSMDWSPDGMQLAFQDGQNIYIMNIDGTGRRIVARAPGNSYYVNPIWSPDGVSITFYDRARADKRTQELYVVNTVTGAITYLAPFGYQELIWSPDSRFIWVDNAVRISVEDGTIERLTPEGIETYFNLSPDGDYVVYHPSGAQNEPRFTIVDAVSLEVVNELYDRNGMIGNLPVWSLDSQGLYFSGFNGTLQYIHMNGTNRREIIGYTSDVGIREVIYVIPPANN